MGCGASSRRGMRGVDSGALPKTNLKPIPFSKGYGQLYTGNLTGDQEALFTAIKEEGFKDADGKLFEHLPCCLHLNMGLVGWWLSGSQVL